VVVPVVPFVPVVISPIVVVSVEVGPKVVLLVSVVGPVVEIVAVGPVVVEFVVVGPVVVVLLVAVGPVVVVLEVVGPVVVVLVVGPVVVVFVVGPVVDVLVAVGPMVVVFVIVVGPFVVGPTVVVPTVVVALPVVLVELEEPPEPLLWMKPSGNNGSQSGNPPGPVTLVTPDAAVVITGAVGKSATSSEGISSTADWVGIRVSALGDTLVTTFAGVCTVFVFVFTVGNCAISGFPQTHLKTGWPLRSAKTFVPCRKTW
jgi:hypothetical protein